MIARCYNCHVWILLSIDWLIVRQLAISTAEVKRSLAQIRIDSVRRGKQNAERALKEYANANDTAKKPVLISPPRF